ncbi:hypothetical protein AWB77_01949 [Caballeronia fortuita]|uniref:Lipoprotein n=1 Tax=Caballeronia fortuita TaxID=1777138 RepID=A0A158AN91_9BURK|nr:hypothetical protein [Caballeronia fortuita]SAK59215.1 hypothetical protein AWB77_01949 [Caballeronia fortuita]
MKSNQTRHAMFVAIATIALSAACANSVAASGIDDAEPLALTVQTPSGGISRLTYADEDGWRIDDRDARLKPMEARITPASTEPQKEAPSTDRPMTVFIDGPTGFTYVWMRDQGWKYVGKLAGRNR